jgi:hypothetical protein
MEDPEYDLIDDLEIGSKEDLRSGPMEEPDDALMEEGSEDGSMDDSVEDPFAVPKYDPNREETEVRKSSTVSKTDSNNYVGKYPPTEA